MADRPKPKPKGERNADRKNGKAFKKNPKRTKARRPGSESPWELAKAKRKARRAKDPEVRNRAKKHRAAKKSDAA